jgi:hypothetical protein
VWLATGYRLVFGSNKAWPLSAAANHSMLEAGD